MRILAIVLVLPLLMGAAGSCGSGTGQANCDQPPARRVSGALAETDDCEEKGEGYTFKAVVGVEQDKLKGRVWVDLQTDESGTMRTVRQRVAPVTITHRVAKQPERDIYMIVKITDDAGTPVFAAGMGSAMCVIEHFGGPQDGNIIDVTISGKTLQEVRCLKPRGE